MEIHTGAQGPSVSNSWYVLHLYVDSERFLTRYASYPFSVRKYVREVLYFKRADKALYEREGAGVFAGYVFVNIASEDVSRFSQKLRKDGLGEILGLSEGVAAPIGTEEMERIIDSMKSNRHSKYQMGDRVRIVTGPYEGMEGTISSVIGQSVSVKVPLRRSVSYAETTMENLEAVA